MLDAGESFLQILSCLLVSNGFQGSGLGLCQEDAFNGLAVKGMVTNGMVKGHVDVIGVVGFFEVKDEAGMKAAVAGVFLLEPGKEGFCCLPQGEEGLFDGLQAVADLFGNAMLRLFHGFACSIG